MDSVMAGLVPAISLRGYSEFTSGMRGASLRMTTRG